MWEVQAAHGWNVAGGHAGPGTASPREQTGDAGVGTTGDQPVTRVVEARATKEAVVSLSRVM